MGGKLPSRHLRLALDVSPFAPRRNKQLQLAIINLEALLRPQVEACRRFHLDPRTAEADRYLADLAARVVVITEEVMRDEATRHPIIAVRHLDRSFDP
jgi:hypothetical protein